MGCDIHPFVERRENGRWEAGIVDFGRNRYDKSPFGWRSYGVFGFLADVRNYSRVPTIAECRGLPDDVSDYVRQQYEEWQSDAHSASWVTVKELLDFDYDREFEDLRVVRQTGPNSWNHGATGEPGEGEMTTIREFLDGAFFSDLETLAALGPPEDVRVVFWFDN
jgi:hypothetical protein